MVKSDPTACLDVTLKDKMRKVKVCTREDGRSIGVGEGKRLALSPVRVGWGRGNELIAQRISNFS